MKASAGVNMPFQPRLLRVPRGDNVPSIKIMRFSMFNLFTFDESQ